MEWLGVHGANCFGIKGTFEERYWWAIGNEQKIREWSGDPLKHRGWVESKEPWQFLAWCYEWVGYLDHGLGFVSRVPIALDGTCNGLQHYALMLRDRRTAAAVYLTKPETTRRVISPVSSISAEPFTSTETIDGADGRPIPGSKHNVTEWLVPEPIRPTDFYERIAHSVTRNVRRDSYLRWFKAYRKDRWPKANAKARKRLQRAASTARADSRHLRQLAKDGQINRAMVKPRAMRLVYGEVAWTAQGNIRKFLTDRRESGTLEVLWRGRLSGPVVVYLQQKIAAEIHKEAPAVKDAMGWLKNVARMRKKGSQTITWTTPNSSVLEQHYPNWLTENFKTARGNLKRRTGKLKEHDKRGLPVSRFAAKQVTAFPPNFVHSLDACALAETVRACAAPALGIRDFAMIHDSFATTAAQTDDLHRTALDQMATLYTQHSPLLDLDAWARPLSPVKDHLHTLPKPPETASNALLNRPKCGKQCSRSAHDLRPQEVSPPQLAADLDALEIAVTGVRVKVWWPWWPVSSTVRPHQSRFLSLERNARLEAHRLRDVRLGNWERVVASPMSLLHAMSIQTFGVYQQRMADEEMALTGQLDRVRFILTSKQGDEYGARGVFLGGLGAILGAVGIVIAIVTATR